MFLNSLRIARAGQSGTRYRRCLPLGTAYAIWTGIGTVGTVIFGIVALNEPASALRLGCIAMIIGGIVGLKLTTA